MSSEDVMTITPLGSGQEVGRSCHVVEFRNWTILLDCGIHPGYEGMNGLPFLDRVDPAELDAVLITHFHLDHAASLPYLTERTNFSGRIFMTHPTKAVLRLLLGDYLRLLTMRQAKPEDVLYTESELQSCMDKIELMDYHETVSLPGGFSFYALNAGHVLGACMYWMDFPGGRSILYTGDYSMEEDRHLMAAEWPGSKPDVLMVESTYGVQKHASRIEREARFTGTVERVVTRGGKCLIPVFALGRAQELLLILDEYWQSHPTLQHVPIYYASKMASRALRVYQTYANMMNERIRSQMNVSNPFHFVHIQNLKSIQVQNDFNDSQPSVVFASPGMLQSGVSRQLFDRWASDAKNGCLIAGYAVEHTLAKEILHQPREVVTLEGKRQPLNCLVDYVSFSAHVDFIQNRSFIQGVDPKHILLVHGAKEEMGRLKSALLLQYRTWAESKRPTITMPPNLQEVQYKFPRRKQAKVMGKLAEEEEQAKQPHHPVKGILVTHNFRTKVVREDELATYTPLRLGSIQSKLHIPWAGASLATVELFLNEMYAGVTKKTSTTATTVSSDDGDASPNANTTTTIFGLREDQITLTVPPSPAATCVLEWKASPTNDILADSIVALLMHAQSSTASIRLTSQPCGGRKKRGANDDNDDDDDQATKKLRNNETMSEYRLRWIKKALGEQFEEVEMVVDSTTKATYTIHPNSSGSNAETKDVECTATIQFDDETGSGAVVAVEQTPSSGEGAEGEGGVTSVSDSSRLVENVRTCLQNLTKAAAPIPT